MNLPINTNYLGLGLIVLGGLVAGVGLFFGLGDAVTMLGVGSAVILADILLRLRWRLNAGWLYKSEFGGTLLFLPMWVIGILAIVGGVANALTGAS